MRRIPIVSGAGLFILGLLTTSGTAAGRDEPADMKAIEAIWKKRQDRVKTAAFDLDNIVTKSEKGLKAPPGTGDFNTGYRASVTFAGDKHRYTYRGMTWNSSVGEPWPVEYVGAYDGTIRTALTKYPGKGIGPHGLLYRGALAKQNNDANMLTISAIVLSILPQSELNRSWRLDGHKPTGETEKVDGYPCVVIAREWPNDAQRQELCLDPKFGWNVRQVRTISRGQTLVYTIDYTADPVIDWVPKSWEAVMRSGGQLLESQNVSVREYKLNEKVDEAIFKITFPPGTDVYEAGK